MARRKSFDQQSEGVVFETQDAVVLTAAYEKAVRLLNPKTDAVIKKKLANIILDIAARSLKAGEDLATAGRSDELAASAVARLLSLTASA